MITSDVLMELIEKEDVIDVIWHLLNAIWKPENNITEYYRKGEESTNETERTLRDIFFEIYDLLYEKIHESRPDLKYPLIVMDGLSVREGNLIREILKQKGYAIVDYTYTFSFLPSVTEEFSRAVFNAPNPSAIKGDFRYERVMYGRVPFNSLSEEKSVVWVNYPDYLLHHAGKIMSPEESFERTLDALLEVLKRFETERVTITSDHGYIFVDRVWHVSEVDARFLRSIFKGERFAFISDIEEGKVEKLKRIPKELSWVLKGDSYYVIKGRYAYPVGGSRIVTHGGISLMECILPLIEVKL